MKTYSIKCPDCGATLDAPEGREYCFCTYCGSKIFVDDERTKRIRITDDAKIRRAEARERIEMAKLEYQKQQKEKDDRIGNALIWLFIFMGVGSFLFLIIGAILEGVGIIK